MIDTDLENAMDEVLDIVVLGRAARNKANIKNRQPISDLYVVAQTRLDSFYTDIIRDELNVKNVEFRDSVEEFITYTFKPQLRTVGPKYGKQLNQIRTALAEINGAEAMKQLEDEGMLRFNFDGVDVELTRDDLLIDTGKSDDFVSEGDNKVTVVLKTVMTPELIEEGFVREIISKVQTMRKEAGFEVMDHITLCVDKNARIEKIVTDNAATIKTETLTDELVCGQTRGYVKTWELNGESVEMGVEKR